MNEAPSDSRTEGIEKANNWMIAHGFKSNRWTARLMYDYAQAQAAEKERKIDRVVGSNGS